MSLIVAEEFFTRIKDERPQPDVLSRVLPDIMAPLPSVDGTVLFLMAAEEDSHVVQKASLMASLIFFFFFVGAVHPLLSSVFNIMKSTVLLEDGNVSMYDENGENAMDIVIGKHEEMEVDEIAYQAKCAAVD